MNGRNRQESALTPKQARLLAALLVAPSLGEAAKTAGVPERTARVWRQLPAFRQALADGRRQSLEEATTRAAAALVGAVDVLTSIMNDKAAPVGTRLVAARAILQTAPALLEAHDFDERLAALEVESERRKMEEQP